MDKEIERFNNLSNAYDQQKLRIIKIMEYDSKRIGIKRLAEDIGVEWSYLYRIFAGGYVSHAKILEIYMHIQEMKKRLGVYDE